jgi:MscS family membrane protein
MKKVGLGLALVGIAVLAQAEPPDWASGINDRFPGVFLGLATWQWIGLLALLVLGALGYLAVNLVAKNIIRLREMVSGKKIESGRHGIARGFGLLGFILPWYLLLDTLQLPVEAHLRFLLGVNAAFVLAVVLLTYGLWDAVCDALNQRASGHANAEKLLIPVTRKLVRFVILLAGILLALGVFGVNITGLLAGVGIGGLVVALAAKDSVENVFGSLTILFDMPFALGDLVKIDKYEGTVEEINLRSTRIRTFEDSVITLPNSNLIKAAVENFGARRYRRQRFHIRVSYANNAKNLERFMQALRDYLSKEPKVVHDRTVVELNDMTEMSVGILVQCFFEADNAKDEARLRGDLMSAIFQIQSQTGVVFIGTPIPPPEEKPRKISKEMEKLIIEKEDII